MFWPFRMPLSSLTHVVNLGGSGTGAISLRKRPRLVAASARLWLSMASSSCSLRVTENSLARISAVSPMLILVL